MTAASQRLLRLSLVIVWLGTACVSWIEINGLSMQLLENGGLSHRPTNLVLIWAGIAADALLGLALWCWPSRWVYAATFGMMLVMTAIATWLSPALWLHPLGLLLKNIPIAAVLWVLWQENGTAPRP